MEHINPYAAPTSEMKEIEPVDSAATAILIGVAIGTGTAYAILSLSGLVFLWILTTQGVPAQQLYVRAYQSTGYLLLAHALGFLCELPGGYWSARLSNIRPANNALLAGLLGSALAFAQNLTPYELPVPVWSRIVSIVVPVPAFLLGALWQRRKSLPIREAQQ